MHTALEIVFWVCAALIVWTQVGYAAALAILARLFARKPTPDPAPEVPLPSLSLIVAAHDEESVIAAKVANALALDYPRELLEVIVTCDGCTDATAEHAREAGADVVLELARGGKIRAQDAAVERARGGDRGLLRRQRTVGAGRRARQLVGAFADPHVGYACGQVHFMRATGVGATNQEGAYWRYEMAVREHGVTAVFDHRGQRRDLRHPSRHLPRGRSDHGPRPLVPVQHGQARPARGVCAAERARLSGWCPRSRASWRASGA